MKKAYTANQNGVELFHMWTYNQSKIEWGPLRANQNRVSFTFKLFFRFGGFFSGASSKFFLRRRRKALYLCRFLPRRVSIKKTRTHWANQRDVSLLKKNFRFKEQAERVRKYWCKRPITSSRYFFVRGNIHSLFVPKALTRSFGFSLKQLVNTTPYVALSMT